jgi:hypothetical protein
LLFTNVQLTYTKATGDDAAATVELALVDEELVRVDARAVLAQITARTVYRRTVA